MNRLFRQLGSLGIAGLLSMTVWQTSAEATCGDYLTSHGETHQVKTHIRQSGEFIPGNRLPSAPRHCPHGQCRSQPEPATPMSSTSDSRIVDEVRPAGCLSGLNSASRGGNSIPLRPTDEPLPESPCSSELERPPQVTSV